MEAMPLVRQLVSDVTPEELQEAVRIWQESATAITDQSPDFEIDPHIYEDFSGLTLAFIEAMKCKIPARSFPDLTAYGLFCFTVGRILERRKLNAGIST